MSDVARNGLSLAAPESAADGPGVSSPGGPPQRLVTRLVLEFLITLTTAASKAHDGDFKAMIVFMAIQHANVEYLESDPKRAADYLDGYPSDDLRRPITAHALSQSVSLPPETCRRYVQRLTAQGYCRQIGGRGLIVPSEVMTREPFATSIDATYDGFIALLKGLNGVGFDVLAAAGGRAGGGSGLVRPPPASMKYALSSVMTGYVMRVILDGVGIHGKDFVRGLIFITVMAMNVEAITHDPGAAWRFADAQTPPPDSMREPVTVRAVSERTGVAYETVRQHLIRMVDLGRASRSGGGFVIPVSVAQDPINLQSGLRIYTWLMRAVVQLERLGFDFDAAVLSRLWRRPAYARRLVMATPRPCRRWLPWPGHPSGWSPASCSSFSSTFWPPRPRRTPATSRR